MTDVHLWALIVMVAGATIIGFIAQRNAEKFRQNRVIEKNSERWKKLWVRFLQYYGAIDNNEINQKLYINEIQQVSVRVESSLAEGDFESVIGILESALDKTPAERKVLTAVHPDQFEFDIASPMSSITTAVESTLYENTFYNVDLGKRTCTCNDFKNFEHYDLNTPQRICRHQYAAIKGNKLSEFGYIGDLVLSSPYREQFYGEIKTPELHLILGYGVPLDWVSIWILFPEGFNDRHSYSLQTNQWSYGDSPKGIALKTRKAIKNAFQL